jgi:hypothetical protein
MESNTPEIYNISDELLSQQKDIIDKTIDWGNF